MGVFGKTGFPPEDPALKKFVGLHGKPIVIRAVDQERRVLETRRFERGETKATTAWLAAPGPSELVLEMTAYYEWFVKRAEPPAEPYRRCRFHTCAGRILLTHGFSS